MGGTSDPFYSDKSSLCQQTVECDMGSGNHITHYSDVIMSALASQITGISIVYSAVCLGADQKKHQSSVSLAFREGNPLLTSGFPSQRASNTENVSI